MEADMLIVLDNSCSVDGKSAEGIGFGSFRAQHTEEHS